VTARVNSAEGGTNAATVTTANSGGTSGDAWDSVNIPSGSTVTFATAAAYKGSRGYRITSGTNSGHGADLQWSLAGWTMVRQRFYVRFSAFPTSETQLTYVSSSGSSRLLTRVSVTTSGRFKVLDASFNGVWTATSSLSLNTWYRVELIVVPGTTATNGTIRFAYAAADGAAAESFASTTANTGTGGSLGRFYVGKLGGTWNANLDLDDLAADDQSSTTFLGASAASGTPVVVDPTPPPGAVVVEAPDVYGQAIRSSVKIGWSVSAIFAGAPVDGATDLAPAGGSITDTNKPGARRVLNVDLAPDPGVSADALFDLLEPVGTLLTVVAHVEITGGIVVDVPMGVFVIDSVKLSAGDGKVVVTAPDQWVRVQRSQFLQPRASSPGSRVSDQAAALISEVTGAPVQVDASSAAEMGAQVWEKDREDAILKMLDGIGAWASFDRNGTCIIADVPTAGSGTVWLADASTTGVLVSLDRERSRTDTKNVIIVSSSATDEEFFTPQVAWDNDPASPTFAGFDDGTGKPNPATAGPFGCRWTTWTRRCRWTTSVRRRPAGRCWNGSAAWRSQVSLSMVPNPAVDAFDLLDVLPPRPDRNSPRIVERHVVDTVTHPLTIGQAMTIDGRAVGTAS
jgi:hypothetical protein